MNVLTDIRKTRQLLDSFEADTMLALKALRAQVNALKDEVSMLQAQNEIQAHTLLMLTKQQRPLLRAGIAQFKAKTEGE